MNKNIIAKTVCSDNETKYLFDLLPQSYTVKDSLLLYQPFLFRYFPYHFLKQNSQCIEVTLFLLYKYLNYSLAVNKLYQKIQSNQKQTPEKEKLRLVCMKYTKQFGPILGERKTDPIQPHNFTYNSKNYLFIGNKPLTEISLSGTIVGHQFVDFAHPWRIPNMGTIQVYLDDCSVPLNCGFEDDIVCVIPSRKLKKGVRKLVGEKVQIKGRISIDSMKKEIIINAFDILFLDGVAHEITNHKIANQNVELLETVGWVLPLRGIDSSNMDTKFFTRKLQWERYREKHFTQNLRENSPFSSTKINGRYDLFNYFLYLIKPPELRLLNESHAGIICDLENVIFLEILKKCYQSLDTFNSVVDLTQEFDTNTKIADAIIHCIKQINHIESDAVLLYFNHVKSTCLASFSKYFKNSDYIVDPEKLVDYCEKLYIKLKKRLYYNSQQHIISCHTELYIENSNLLYVLVKHVCYNYLQIKFAEDSDNLQNRDIFLENIKIQLSQRVKITLYLNRTGIGQSID